MAQLLNDDGDGLEQWPPLRLVRCAHAGSLLIASQFLWIVLHEGLVRLHRHFVGPHLGLFSLVASLLLLFAPIMTGATLIGLGSKALSDGLIRLKWSEAEIKSACLWAESHELNRTAVWLLAGVCGCDFVVSYLLFNVWKVAHSTPAKLFFESLALLCIPSLVVSELSDTLRRDGPSQG